MAAAQHRTVLVLYGSETGNAQEIAEELGRTCQRLHFQTTVEEMNAVTLPELLQNELVIFVVSTTGQGDIPHNSTLFWKRLLQRRLPADCLTQVQYTCFGLGDSTYVKFNWAARKLIRRLDQLGASTFYETFEADEQFPDGIEGSFARWSDGLSKHLLDKHSHPPGLEPIPNDVILPPRWSLEPALRGIEKTTATSKQPQENGDTSPKASSGNTPPADLLHVPGGWTATLAVNERATPESHWQDVRLVSFDVPPRAPPSASGAAPEPLRCQPGDCLTIYPRNFPADAERLIALMGWEAVADEPLDLSKCGALPRGLFVPPTPTTLRRLLLDNIDITAIPRRSFLKSMSFFSTDEYHRERLLEFTLPDYVDEYFDYATRARRTIIEVLEEFTSVRLPAARLLDIFPLIRGRDFSIANGGDQLLHQPTGPGSGASSCTRVDLLVAMVRYRTVLRKPREGLCSRYLASLPVGAALTVTKKDVLSPVHGAACARRPLIALVTGTGVAPVRSLIHERLTHQAARGAVGPMLLFFGNRNRAADYFFESEWAALGGEKTADDNDEIDSRLLTVFPAFSRDQREKVYVQDLVRREAAALAALIPRRPVFAVCGGSSRMAEACRRAVWEPFLDAAGGNEAERAERRRMLDEVTWWQEIW
ncbi:sulfite reductase flavoprotein alpha-component [Cordyceps fumosorosea ARSEF 2679]|uniref:NADPH-dependent diflavin oxidoreductase 1 n=1 Tax=Cordyceps fumosorosea (strain ARSEF 2679) TaxID=1081104 RepID=A0A168AMP5_CORFA|nr:sulfite reductase flavoprotein alpha-component [Cordyceps fumosorosea ARSEF 2679]OAA68951.1 sulfite reductase flavoprotein alpha-component [Cordyceps fumosorosea ARSEF 2679]